jgi:carbamoyl-phosphate synthase large subunit
VVEYTQRIAAELGVKGLLNLQFVVHENRVYVLEVNLRSSRTVPFVSKVTGLPLVKLAVRAIMGQSLTDQGCVAGLQPRPDRVGVKLPVFSWSKLSGVDTILGPEMKSTGEVMSLAGDVPRALYKALLAGGFELSGEGSAIITLADADKKQALQAVKAVYNAGYGLYATKKTAAFLEQAGLPVQRVSKLSEEKAKAPDILEVLTNGDVALVVNTYTSGGQPERDGYQLRRAAAELGVPCVTSLDTLGMLAGVLNELAGVPLQEAHITALQDLHMPIE